MENETAYLLTNNGLGDYLTMIGAIKFLLKYYKRIYMLCRTSSAENVNLFFTDDQVTIIPIPPRPPEYKLNSYAHFIIEAKHCIKIINEVPDGNDIFICGTEQLSGGAIKPKITNTKLLQYEPNDREYTIKMEWNHIREFYSNIGLDLSIYYEYFDITSTVESQQYYEDIKSHKIIFTHTKASDHEIQIPNIISKYINDENAIIICANKSVYPTNHPKYELANRCINIPIAYYIDIIKNANEIHVVDSCFSCIVNPLQQTNRLSATNVMIYNRVQSIKSQTKSKSNPTMKMHFV